MENTQLIGTVQQPFEWPTSQPPHPMNFTLASKMCTILILKDPSIKTAVAHFNNGFSSNDVIQVTTQRNEYIVKIPRQPPPPKAAATCKAEAMRTAWAARCGVGPKVLCIDPESGGFAMERLRGHTLTAADMMQQQRLPQIVRLLLRIHTAPPAKWMWRYDPINSVTTMLEAVKRTHAIMAPTEVRLIEEIVSSTKEVVDGHPWVLCHNDFHSHNIFLQPVAGGTRSCTKHLMAIDFEECDLGDP
ncbi:MAG: hypothetical protein LQ339_008593, partial [Xanthoria mediterranea]